MRTMQLPDLLVEADPELPAFFLGRLASVVAHHAITTDPKERAALGEAAFSIFLDCLDLGLSEEAHAITGQVRDVAQAA
jgi:hypothetical protein